MTSPTERIIDASVSKAFFVEMLVRDISLDMAIHDLLDNCIDGALRLRGEGSFEGLEVDITWAPDQFKIRDNCGGIDVDIARNYAFRFGRPKDAPSVSHSVGRFGVGMKRAVFKLGGHFAVQSTSKTHRFVMEVDVSEWEAEPEWQFKFRELEDFVESAPLEDRGTEVRVTGLFESVSERFQDDIFVSRLQRSIESRHQTHLDRGLVVRLNGRSIVGASVHFYVLSGQDQLFPAFNEDSHYGVTVRQYAGVGPRSPADAGWYIFCNGRMILRADQSEVTGWGESNIERLPKYHNDFAWFRGCVFFDSDDPDALPWNTTKDSVDQDSGLYRTVRTQMITMMTPVLQFLRSVADEDPEQPLTDLLQNAPRVPVSRVQRHGSFHYAKKRPSLPPEKKPTGIQYSKPTGLVNKVKERLGVNTNRAVGEKTFDYFVGLEEIEE